MLLLVGSGDWAMSFFDQSSLVGMIIMNPIVMMMLIIIIMMVIVIVEGRLAWWLPNPTLSLATQRSEQMVQICRRPHISVSLPPPNGRTYTIQSKLCGTHTHIVCIIHAPSH